MLTSTDEIDPKFGQLLLDYCRKASRNAVEPEHFLLALLDSDEGELARACRRVLPSVALPGLRKSLLETSRNSLTQVPPADVFSTNLLSTRGRALWDQCRSDSNWSADTAERTLAHATLGAVLPRINQIIRVSGLDPDQLRNAVLTPQAAGPQPIFNDQGKLIREVLHPSARAVVKLVESEGSSLGQSRVSSPLLLYALVAYEQGVIDRALRIGGSSPKELRESLLQHLRGMSKGSRNDDLSLARPCLQPVIERTFERATGIAHSRGYSDVGDEDLAAALFLEDQHFVKGFLESRDVDIQRLSSFFRNPRPETVAEAEEPESHQLPPLPEVLAQLRARVVRQDHVIDALAPFLKRLWFGYRRKTRPLAVLLFLGNSGTGKTQLAKELARAIYGSDEQLLFFEMGQFGSELSKNVFVGAPQGYVGYGDGRLTNGLRDKPESVVLFDEVEKAHASVFDVLLRFLDEGVISDPAGPVRDGRKCVIILTSNKQIDQLQDLVRLQMAALECGTAERDAARSRIRQILVDSGSFRREFVNRIDELLLFNALDEQAYRRILQLELDDEQRRLKEEKDLHVEFAPPVLDLLLQECLARREEGARVCGKVISASVISAVIDFFVDEANAGAEAARVTVGAQGEIVVQRLEAVR